MIQFTKSMQFAMEVEIADNRCDYIILLFRKDEDIEVLASIDKASRYQVHKAVEKLTKLHPRAVRYVAIARTKATEELFREQVDVIKFAKDEGIWVH